MATANSAVEYLFIQKQTVQGTIPNSSGTATVANADAIRGEPGVSLNFGGTSIIDRDVKNGSLSATIGVAGRKDFSWNFPTDLHGSGTPGTKGDLDELLECSFGKAGVISGGVSVTYGLEDASPYFALWSFREPSTMDQRVLSGCVVQSCNISLGGDLAKIVFSGEGTALLTSGGFAAADAISKAGLTSFPSRPASPSYNGTAALGFVGTITLDGNTYTTIRQASISIGLNRSLKKNGWNSFYPGAAGQRQRVVTIDFSLDDEDTANLTAFKNKAIAGTPVAISFTVGSVAGNIFTFTMPVVLLSKPVYDDGDDIWGVSFSGCRAYGSSGSAKDEITMVCT